VPGSLAHRWYQWHGRPRAAVGRRTWPVPDAGADRSGTREIMSRAARDWLASLGRAQEKLGEERRHEQPSITAAWDVAEWGADSAKADQEQGFLRRAEYCSAYSGAVVETGDASTSPPLLPTPALPNDASGISTMEGPVMTTEMELRLELGIHLMLPPLPLHGILGLLPSEHLPTCADFSVAGEDNSARRKQFTLLLCRDLSRASGLPGIVSPLGHESAIAIIEMGSCLCAYEGLWLDLMEAFTKTAANQPQ